MVQPRHFVGRPIVVVVRQRVSGRSGFRSGGTGASGGGGFCERADDLHIAT